MVKGNGHGNTPASPPLQETPTSLPLVNGHDARDKRKVDRDAMTTFPS